MYACCGAWLQVVKGFVSLCSTMRAGADPVLLCCFLRAIRGLATHHRANAEVLGQSAIMHIKELSRTSKDDLDLVSFGAYRYALLMLSMR